MTPLRQRMIEDMQLRNFATTTQRSYIHYVADFAKHFNRSPQDLDLEAVRQYQLYLAQERKLSPQSIIEFCIKNAIVNAKKGVVLIEGCNPAISPATSGYLRSNG